jgi:hypothetical protein
MFRSIYHHRFSPPAALSLEVTTAEMQQRPSPHRCRTRAESVVPQLGRDRLVILTNAAPPNVPQVTCPAGSMSLFASRKAVSLTASRATAITQMHQAHICRSLTHRIKIAQARHDWQLLQHLAAELQAIIQL